MFRKKLTNSTQRIQNCWENTVKNPGKDGDEGERKGWKKTQKCDIMITYHNFAKTEEEVTMNVSQAKSACDLRGGAVHG